VQRGRIEYEGETSVYTQISPLKIRGKDEYILIFPGGKNEYILIFPGEKLVLSFKEIKPKYKCNNLNTVN
jgi:hypothetical protein